MVSIVIPALNEEDKIRNAVATVVSAAKAAGNTPIDIIIVNDGSTDRTGEISDQLAVQFPFVRVVHHPTNQGMASAFRDALRLAKFDQLTLFPGDNAVAQFTLCNMFLSRDKADYVVAMIINTEFRSGLRIFLSALHSLIYTTTFALPIRYINAPALWPVKILRQMPLRAERYSLHAEINVKLLRRPITFLEVDGYMNPESLTSAALRFNNLASVMGCYLRLCWEVFVTRRNDYSDRARRILPSGVLDRPPNEQ